MLANDLTLIVICNECNKLLSLAASLAPCLSDDLLAKATSEVVQLLKNRRTKSEISRTNIQMIGALRYMHQSSKFRKNFFITACMCYPTLSLASPNIGITLRKWIWLDDIPIGKINLGWRELIILLVSVHLFTGTHLLIQFILTCSRSVGYRFGPHLAEAVPLLVNYCRSASENDEELREYSLQVRIFVQLLLRLLKHLLLYGYKLTSIL
jgi:hypothetical protein